VKILVIVNDSPWGSGLAVTALRLVRAMLARGQAVDAVYFRGEGVYNAVSGRSTDSGTPELAAAWRSLGQQHGLPLLLCSSATVRRLDFAPGDGFREAGLPEVMERMQSCGRVVTL
jgi:tRNA 2-thiouridine synthesizing protein D